MVQKTHKHRLTRRVYKYRITARYSTLDEKYAFSSLAMFDIQYLIKVTVVIGGKYINLNKITKI